MCQTNFQPQPLKRLLTSAILFTRKSSGKKDLEAEHAKELNINIINLQNLKLTNKAILELGRRWLFSIVLNIFFGNKILRPTTSWNFVILIS